MDNFSGTIASDTDSAAFWASSCELVMAIQTIIVIGHSDDAGH